MDHRFSVRQWAAWAPGLTTREDWLAWFAQPSRIAGDATPPLPDIPAMMRRRIEKLGRVALQSAYDALDGASDDIRAACPAVFASRYGDMRRSMELMKQLAAEGAVSPTAFSVSVHNAFAALFSIARGDRSSYSAVASGPESAEHAFVEAVGLLAEGAPEVLVVYYEEPLPAPLEHFSAPNEFLRGWACRIAPAPGRGGIAFALSSAPHEADTPESDLPADLELLRFLTDGNAASHERTVAGRRWRWDRA